MEHPWNSTLVTGASSGIGAAIARQLGAAGVPLVLVARRTGRLEELGASVSGRVEVVAADLTVPADLDRVTERAAGVDLLVNCAGLGASGPFVDGDLGTYHQVLALNIDAVVELTHAALGGMTARRRGWVCNVSSMGGHAPGPGFAVYSATKAFVTSFSESLHEEVRDSGIVVTSGVPRATRTEFGEVAGALDGDLPSMLWQTAEEVAAEALGATAAGRAVRVTGTVNRLSAAVTTVLPRYANRKISALVTSRL